MFSEAIAMYLRGGLVMHILLLASIITVAVSIERYLYFKSADSGRDFVGKVSEKLDKDNFVEAKNLCQSTKGFNSEILLHAMNMQGMNAAFVEKYLENQAGIRIAKLRERVPYLGIIVTMAPLLGLLGTVVGMISSFNVFSAQSGQPHAITGGVGEALIATASGLCVAILALIAHSYFAQHMDNIITDMEQTFSSYIEMLNRRAMR